MEIGRGGMGIVYRAWDPELGREVALKRPASDLASTPDGRRRFLREARATARLSHPHIVRVHDVFEHDGVPWLAMEFIRGESLRSRLAAGARFETGDIVRHGEALASALAAAHAEGILHRDIKPHNILLAADGRALLTDFGLARFFVDPGRESDAPTGSGEATDERRILGTPGYMSPEQALGRPVDPRSDLFSLGVVLYEMWIGLGTFTQESRVESAEDVLRRAPRGEPAATDATTAALGRIVAKALALRPEDRYQHAADLCADLGALRRRPGASDARGSGAAASAVATEIRPLRGRRFGARVRRTAWLGGAALVTLGIGWLLLDAARQDGRRAGHGMPEMEAVVTWPGMQFNGRLSPDGEWVSFVSGRDGALRLWIRRLDGGEPRPLDLPEGEAVSHIWSPDGQRIAYLALRGAEVHLQVAPVFGGPPEETYSLPREFMDGQLERWIGRSLLITIPMQGLRRIDLDGGRISAVLSAEAPEGFRSDMEVSDDGRRVAYTLLHEDGSGLRIHDLEDGSVTAPLPDTFECRNPHWLSVREDALLCSSTQGGQVDIWRIPIRNGDPTRITFSSEVEEVEDATADGSVLLFRRTESDAHLWLLDPATAATTQLTADALNDNGPSAGSATPLVAFERSMPRVGPPTGESRSQILLGRLGPRGLEAPEVLVVDGRDALLSPSGEWLAFTRISPPKRAELWVAEIRTGVLGRVSADFAAPRNEMVPADRIDLNLTWGEDGRLLFSAATPAGGSAIFRHLPGEAPARNERLLSGDPGTTFSDLWVSPDGSRLAYVRSTGQFRTSSVVRALDLRTGEDRGLLAYEHGIDELLLCRGWSAGGAGVIALRASTGSFWNQSVEVLELDLRGRERSVAHLERAFAGTARLDRERGRVYLTALAPDSSAHGIFEVSLADGSVREVTRNRVAGISYAGIEMLPDGTLLFARQDRNDSLWSIRFHE